MVNSLLDQTVKVDQIVFVTPPAEMVIPKYITNIAVMIPAGKDYGKCTKLLPVLLREKESDTIILCLDDTTVYGKDFIETMVSTVSKNPETVLTTQDNSVILVRPSCFGPDVVNRGKDVYDINWFLNKAKKSMVVEYQGNMTY
jgi:hypothetical protein